MLSKNQLYIPLLKFEYSLISLKSLLACLLIHGIFQMNLKQMKQNPFIIEIELNRVCVFLDEYE